MYGKSDAYKINGKAYVNTRYTLIAEIRNVSTDFIVVFI